MYCDLSGKIVYDPARLTVKELKKVLEDLKLIPANATHLCKADLKQLLQNWIDQQQPEPGVENDLLETGQRKQLKTAVSGKDEITEMQYDAEKSFSFTYTAR